MSVATLIGVIVVWMPAWLVVGPMFAVRVPVVGFLALLMPFLGVYMIYYALNVATLAFDRSGWRYRRRIFGFKLETDEGRWTDITRTTFRQRLSTSRESTELIGEFSLAGSYGFTVLTVQTKLYSRGNLIGKHAVRKRRLGLSVDDFSAFVRLINHETPQLGYEWVPAPIDERAHGPAGIFPSAGPDRYVAAPRRGLATNAEPVDGEPVDAEPGWGGLPVPF